MARNYDYEVTKELAEIDTRKDLTDIVNGGAGFVNKKAGNTKPTDWVFMFILVFVVIMVVITVVPIVPIAIAYFCGHFGNFWISNNLK